MKKGELKCPTEEEKSRLEDRVAELKQEMREAKEREIAEKKRKEEEKKEAARKEAEEKKEAAKRVEEETKKKKVDSNTAEARDAELNQNLEASKLRMAELTKQIQTGQRVIPPPPSDWAEQHLQALARGEDPQKLGLPRPNPTSSSTPQPRNPQAEANSRRLEAIARGEDPAKAEQDWALRRVQEIGSQPIQLAPMPIPSRTGSAGAAPAVAAQTGVSPARTSPALVPLDEQRLRPYRWEDRTVQSIAASTRVAVLPPSPPTSTFSAPSVNAGVPKPTTYTFADAQIARDKLWPRMGVPSDVVPQAPNHDKLKNDWAALQLADASYNDNLQPGSTIFKDNSDWKVLERKEDKDSGFLAYTFVNIKEHKAVVTVQGSRNPIWLLDTKGLTTAGRDAKQDWSQDISAIALGKTPVQFSQAESYVRDVSARFGDKYSIDCSGHSLGGGACVYAASKVENVHAIAVTPVSSNALPTSNAYRIDNYVTQRDATKTAHSATERGLTGWKYLVEDDGLGDVPVQRLRTQHDLDRILDSMSKQSGLARYQWAD